MTEHSSVFDPDVLLDIAVNIVPLLVIVLFTVLFVVFNPWAGESLLGRALQFFLLLFPLLCLAVLTYVAARQIEVLEDVDVGP
ncbi:MAG: DUF6684 family protein [Halarchaeum sp.]